MRKTGRLITRTLWSLVAAPIALLWATAWAAPETPAPDTPAPALKPLATTGTPAYGDLDAIRARGVIRVLVPLNRSDFYLDDGKPRGRTAQRLAALADSLKPLEIQYVLTPRERLLSDLAAGRGDLAAGGIEVTDRGLALVDFSHPVAAPAPDVFVSRTGAPAIRTLDDLAGRKVYVRRDSRTLAYVHALESRLKARGLAPLTILSLPESLTEEDLLDMLNAGLIDLTVTSERLARFWARPLPRIRPHAPLESAADPGSSARVAWAFRQESPALAHAINKRIADLPEPSDEDVARWAANARKLQNARAPAALIRLAETLPLFETAGAEHRLDPLVIAAVGFQESRLNQNLKGLNGATGVMQMRPVIAKQMKAGPLTSLAGNIAAGAKYMAYLADHLFEDAPESGGPDLLNRSLFAAAAYNMGPDRITAARRKARAMGLDPDVWFDNVELAAMTTAGLRPVLYVRDIFKYYVAYQAELALKTKR